ncbi:MAG: glycoside hydrolase family 10, partial [Verrucomicrobiae bacterium]|nr:glycoside hydrolase family 10 [Verrucomicrobiae bacterium]
PQMAGITWWNLADGTAYENENKALGGLLDENMNPKPAYRELDRLINHEWKTMATLRTDTTGKATFRGFHGRYSIRVTAGGIRREFPFEIKSGGRQNRARLTL